MFFTRFLRQTFHKPSISLLIGLIAAQLITLLWSPILTRLYSPASFALLSVFMASIGIFGNLACWKLEMSVVTREHEEDIWYVAVLSLIAAVLTALLLTTIIFVFFKTTYQYQLIVELALACFLFGAAQLLTQISIRRGAFTWIALSKVAQAVAVGLVSVIFALYAKGIIWAQLTGYFITTLILLPYLYRLWQSVDFPKITHGFRVFKTIAQFPAHALFPSLLDNIAAAIPVYFVIHSFSIEQAGQFGMIRQIIGFATGSFVIASSQLILKFISDGVLQKKSVYSKLNLYFRYLALLYFSGFLLLVLFGNTLIPFVFGEKWSLAAYYAPLVALHFIGPFLVTPFSTALIAFQKLRENGLWQLTHFISVTIICLLIEWTQLEDFLFWFALTEVMWYGFYAILIYRQVQFFEKSIHA